MTHARHPQPLLAALVALGALLLAPWVHAQGPTVPVDPVGRWTGAIQLPGGVRLDIQATFTVDPAGDGGPEPALSGTLDIPAQGLIAYGLDPVLWSGFDLTFAMPGIPGEPTFEGTIAGDQIEGIFTQGGQAFPFTLERASDAHVLRPQEPTPPFPYLEEEVTFDGAGVTLAGTLTLPPGDARVPAVLLITGSGPQDRNEEILGHKPFLLLADTLTRAGLVVLRVDDRGVGGSTGSDADATYEDLAGDVEAGLDLLAAHPRVDGSAIGLLGHSQGGYLAPLVAARRDDVAFVIVIAGPAVDGFAVLEEQSRLLIEATLARQDAAPEVVAAAVDTQIAFLRTLRPMLAAGDLDAARAWVRQRIEEENAAAPEGQRLGADDLESVIAAQQEAVTSASYRSFVAFDPRPHLEALKVPVLAIYGGLDLQVSAAQNEGPMRDALAGNADATVTTLAGLNHLMQPATTGLVDEYAATQVTIDDAVLDLIVAWLAER